MICRAFRGLGMVKTKIPIVIHFTEDENGDPILDVRFNGDGKDAFREDFNEIFSPWSNPNSYKKGTIPTATPFGFKINSENNGVISTDIYVNTALNAPPSKPYLGWYWLGPVQYGWIHLNWNAQTFDGYPIESDYEWSELQRKIGVGTWTTVYSGSNRYWSDHSITYDPNGDTPVYFRVRVRDTQGLWSVWSELFNTKMISIHYDQKIGVQTISERKTN